GDRRRHRLGARARQPSAHADRGIVHRGEIADGERAIRHDPEHHDPDHHQDGHDRTADEQLGEVHGASEAILAPRAVSDPGRMMVTFDPGFSRDCPSTTTSSPSRSPRYTMVIPATSIPGATFRGFA